MAVDRSGAFSRAVACSGVSQFPARAFGSADTRDAGGELRGQQAVVGRLGGQFSKGAEVDVERGGGEALLFQVGPVPLDGGLGQARRPGGAVPVEEPGEGEVVAAAGVWGGYGVEDQGFNGGERIPSEGREGARPGERAIGGGLSIPP